MKKTLIFFCLAVLLLSGASCIRFTAPTFGGVFRSIDQGEAWLQKTMIPTVTAEKKTFGGLDVLDLVFDPQDHLAVYAATVQGLFYTYDAGENWWPARGLVGAVRAAAVDPADKCTIFAAIGNRLYKSIDCSRSWRPYDFEANMVISSLAINPINPSQIYVGMMSGELLKSGDYGRSWTMIKRFNSGIEEILINPVDTRVIYIATRIAGLFKSENAGGAWIDFDQLLQKFTGYREFRAIASAAKDPDTILWAMKTGILITRDGGHTWGQLKLLTPPNKTDIYSLAINPRNSKEFFYGTASTFYKTLNGGERWISKRLPTSRAAVVLRIDPVEPKIIYMGVKKLEE